jgi:hypothetical protein
MTEIAPLIGATHKCVERNLGPGYSKKTIVAVYVLCKGREPPHSENSSFMPQAAERSLLHRLKWVRG